MSGAAPIDYVAAGCLLALYDQNSDRVTHSVTLEYLRDAFWRKFDTGLDGDLALAVLRRMEALGVVSVILDPYAETLLETSDASIYDFFATQNTQVFERAWRNRDWLSSAISNQKLWADLQVGLNFAEDTQLVPSAAGFVTPQHNSADFVAAEIAFLEASDAIRGDNDFNDEHRGWIRSHLDAGWELLKRGGPILKAALVALVVEPLKAAMKATANENVKKLVSLALEAFLKWLSSK